MNRIAIGLIAASLSLHGCASAPPLTCDAHAIDNWTPPAPTAPAIRSLTRGAFTPLGLNAVHFEELDLAHQVMVSVVGATRTETGTVRTTTRLVNCSANPIQVEARTHFLASDQTPTEPVSAWQRVFIPGRSVSIYQETSTATTSVSDFLVEIRRGT